MKKPVVIDHPVNANQFIHEIFPKEQIIGHHTISGPGIVGDINWWNSKPDRVCTAFILDRDGNIYQVFDERYWAYALGIKNSHLIKAGSSLTKRDIERSAIQYEMDNWGGLIKKSDGFYNAYGSLVDVEVQEYATPFRGFKYYEKYSDKQIAALGELLCWLSTTYGIPVEYTYETFFEVSDKALRGERGSYTHCSYRPDKSDLHPQPELIQMLKDLNS